MAADIQRQSIRELSSCAWNSWNVMPVLNDTFAIKISVISMVQEKYQFTGGKHEDPLEHIEKLKEICSSQLKGNVTIEDYLLKLFPFSLTGEAKQWWNLLPKRWIKSWNDVGDKFLKQYCSQARTQKLRDKIMSFMQSKHEPIHAAWTRYQEILNQCPNHSLPAYLLIEYFYKGLCAADRLKLDVSAGGALMSKNPEKAIDLIEEVAYTSYQWESEDMPLQSQKVVATTAPEAKPQHVCMLKDVQSQQTNKIDQPSEEQAMLQEALARIAILEKQNELLQQQRDSNILKLTNKLSELLQEQKARKENEEAINAIQLRSGKTIPTPEPPTEKQRAPEDQAEEEEQKEKREPAAGGENSADRPKIVP